MAYYKFTKDPIGCFIEKEEGNYFEYSVNDDDFDFCKEFAHKVWVGDGYRYANVKKTVAYISVDEDEFGLPVVEKWYTKKNWEYDLNG